MRPICFSPLITDTVNTYKWIHCFDVRGEKWEYKEIYQLVETEEGYWFQHMDHQIFWPTSILVRVAYGPIVE
jgi:hypothetical protein